MRIALRLAGVAFLATFLVGCGSSETPPGAPSPASSTSKETTSGTTPRKTDETPVVSSTAPLTVTETEYAVAEVPYIVGCQQGLGPVETYWSDGSVTGYSEYCQAIHDRVVRGEAEANTPICDGTVCRYPSGATFPDPNPVPDDRCTNQTNYATDPRSNAEINSIGAQTGQCPVPIA